VASACLTTSVGLAATAGNFFGKHTRLKYETVVIVSSVFSLFMANFGVDKIIKISVRKFDIVARYGGEEFGVILLSTGSETAVMVAERIRRNIEKKVFDYYGTEMRVTISGGVAHVKDIEVMEHTEIIRIADEALYESKNNGRNKITLYKKDKKTIENKEME
jgi:predicted signal transduction protein with EAL and GGDEF domain